MSPLAGTTHPSLDGWLSRRTYETRSTLADVLATKDQTISLVLPTRNVAASLGPMLETLAPARESGLLDEVRAGQF